MHIKVSLEIDFLCGRLRAVSNRLLLVYKGHTCFVLCSQCSWSLPLPKRADQYAAYVSASALKRAFDAHSCDDYRVEELGSKLGCEVCCN